MAPSKISPNWFDTFMQALPFRYQDVTAETGTTMHVLIDSDAGGEWFLIKMETTWALSRLPAGHVVLRVVIPVDISWKLFTKAIRYHDVKQFIILEGEHGLALPLLQMIAVIT
jgi:hypothetical protein